MNCDGLHGGLNGKDVLRGFRLLEASSRSRTGRRGTTVKFKKKKVALFQNWRSRDAFNIYKRRNKVRSESTDQEDKRKGTVKRRASWIVFGLEADAETYFQVKEHVLFGYRRRLAHMFFCGFQEMYFSFGEERLVRKKAG